MSDLIQIIIAVSASSGFWAFLQFITNKKSASSRMLLGLGHDVIIRKCLKYIERGWITYDEYKDLKKYLFEPYSAMGGNSTAQDYVDEVAELRKVTREEASRLIMESKEKERLTQ